MAGEHWQLTPVAESMSVPQVTASSYVCTRGSLLPSTDAELVDAEPAVPARKRCIAPMFLDIYFGPAHCRPTSFVFFSAGLRLVPEVGRK